MNTMRHGDDTVLIELEEQFKGFINVIIDDSEDKGMMVNSAKSVTNVFSSK